jgi:hypothetical protein
MSDEYEWPMNALRAHYIRLLEILGAGKVSLLFTFAPGYNDPALCHLD